MRQDSKNYRWNDLGRKVFVGRLLPKAEAWLRFTVAMVPGCTSSQPVFKYQAKVDNGKTSNVDIQHLPPCLPRNQKVWPDMVASVWRLKYKEWVEQEEQRKIVELKRKEDEASRIRQAQQAIIVNDNQAATGNALKALSTKDKVPPQDPALERVLFDCNVNLSEDELKAMAKYVSGRLGLKPNLPHSVLGEMRLYGKVLGVRLFRAPHWLVWLKTSGQYPLRGLDGAEERGVEPQSKEFLFDLNVEPEVFVGADGEEDVGFPEARIEPDEELWRMLEVLGRMTDELKGMA